MVQFKGQLFAPTTYADDKYLLNSGETEKKALENCIKETKIAMKWFLESGLCVNKKKTEVCVFHRNNSRAYEVVLGCQCPQKNENTWTNFLFKT